MTKESKKPKKNDVNEDPIRVPEENINIKQPEIVGKPVLIKAEAYKTIILYASRYANQNIPSPQWKEIYGILIGHADDDFVHVERAVALTHGHSTDVQLDTKHYVFIDEIQRQLDEEGKDYYMVGWWHSHPGLNLFFSYIDLMNQLGFQTSNNDFCGLVFDHTLLGKKKEEKILSEEGVEHKISKFDTGFEIYRITDVKMDVNAPEFDTNYHKVDYIVDGLNKYFFANVLTELSSLVSIGKPLQEAYKEDNLLESPLSDQVEITTEATSNIESDSEKDDLSQIPGEEDFSIEADDLFFGGLPSRNDPLKEKRAEAEQFIYQGNLALKNNDSFTGIEKYKEGLLIFRELREFDKVLELLRKITEQCISSNHVNFAEKFAEELYELAEQQDNPFYKGEGNYFSGYLQLKRKNDDILKIALGFLEEGAIDHAAAGDFAGAARSYYKIAQIYHLRINNLESASLFYMEAINSYAKALMKPHPLRTEPWSNAEVLLQKIHELRDILDEILPRIENPEIKKKINADIASLKIDY